MLSLLELVHDYQLLRVREGSLDDALDDADRARLLGLGRMLQGDVIGADSRRTMLRVPSPQPIEFTEPGGFAVGQIRNISGGGMAISTGRPLPMGTRTIVRVAEVSRGVEFVFPARVVWSSRSLSPIMGVAFDGPPKKSAITLTLPRGAWNDLHLGQATETPSAA